MRSVMLLAFGSISLFAQPFSAGIKAGVPLTDFLNAVEGPQVSYTAPMQRFIVGGTAELRLPMGFGVEFDALYRRLEYNGTNMGVDTFSSSHTSGSDWEFPLLLKYRFHFPVVRPYVDGGVAWQTLTGLKQTVLNTGVLGSVSTSGTPVELKNNTTTGAVIGAGVDIHAIVLHISPEIRYTRWGVKQFSDVAGLLQSNQNQAEFLVGITF